MESHLSRPSFFFHEKDSGGVGFEDSGGELELYDLNLSSSEEPKLVASVKTAARFASVGWSTFTGSSGGHRYPLGLIAGGMADGKVHIWDAQALVKTGGKDMAPIATVAKHDDGPVAALKFHPLEQWKVATGGTNGQVLVIDLSPVERQQQPSVVDPTESESSKQSAEITAVAWNSQVAHILASSSGDGTVTVWDLKQCKAWCKLQVEHGAVTDIAWNPIEGLYLLTASGDDRNPVLKVWDLGASTSMPLTTMTGHAAGILKTAWCPHDETLLLTCAKDNRTLLYDLVTLQPVADLPHDEDAQTPRGAQQQPTDPNQLFSSGTLKEQKHMRVFVAWSPIKRGLALTCSLDRKVQVHSILSLATQSGRPPKWLKPASAISTGFGGAVLAVSSTHRYVVMQTVQEQPKLAQTAASFDAELAQAKQSNGMIQFCEERRAACKIGSSEEKMWGFMRVVFEANAREHLLEHLGYDGEKIATAAKRYSTKDDADAVTNGVESMNMDEQSRKSKRMSTTYLSNTAEETVKRALIVGNFEAAVECLFNADNLADALVVAYCGGADLWTKTQQRYFEKESTKRPYLSMLSGIVQSKMDELVEQSDPRDWRETLAVLSSYAQSEEFPRLCISLGGRLESIGDPDTASLCYICALSVEHASRYWKTQFEAVKSSDGSIDIMALHNLVVKVTVFMMAAGSKSALPDDIAELFSVYAEAVAEQGLFAVASKYSKGSSEKAAILKDRLYRSRESQKCLAELGSPPVFPYTPVAVNKGPQTTRTDSRAKVSALNQQHPSMTQYGDQSISSLASSSYNATPAANDELPPGWIALQDPASGRTYYANQGTGESSWEMPSVPVSIASTPKSAPVLQTSTSTVSASSSNRGNKLVSKYGDGFVTSSSHPELAQQYGNVGTSNPYTGAARPGTAAAVVKGVASPVEPQPEEPIDIHAVELAQQHVQVRDTLLGLYEHLLSISSPTEKRQLDEAKKGIDSLVKKLSQNGLDEETDAKVVAMTSAITSHDFRSATSIQTALVSHEWKFHKDWLKGIKLLLQLASKKYGL